ncbi:hypothetical protein NW063_00225 [Mycoplasmopsis cynos]|uniref:hypothetical protein n=1 Tax=Mycoplasmopsis cynos TaxID=171284 RepID=UPI0021FB2A7B|nr:hypothetical protein [Mycoplasmopsis cynos]UWV86206.1 hypothetical protein NW063_00225 [Mycoplasmopsis cynos]
MIVLSSNNTFFGKYFLLKIAFGFFTIPLFVNVVDEDKGGIFEKTYSLLSLFKLDIFLSKTIRSLYVFVSDNLS